jgi:hypothetical protein
VSTLGAASVWIALLAALYAIGALVCGTATRRQTWVDVDRETLRRLIAQIL